MTGDERLRAYAELAVRVGANLQPGQDLDVNALVEHAPLARAIAEVAYEQGARHVDVLYADQRVRRSLIQRADEDVLAWTPPWLVERADYIASVRGAAIAISGNPEPELLSDLDQRRVGLARMVRLTDTHLRHVARREVAWTIVAYPTPGWAEAVFGEPDVERLWDAVATAVRLDESDPVLAWQDHVDRLVRRADASEHPAWAALARDCGFYDQAHLIREVRAFAGVTPTQLHAERRGAPALPGEDELAAAQTGA
jgi:aminopeptidase